jgi:hypothetical protein
MKYFILLYSALFILLLGASSVSAQTSPQILLVHLGTSRAVPNSQEIKKLDSLLKTLPKGNEVYLLGVKKESNQYAFFSNMRIAQIFPPNAYDSLILNLKSVFPKASTSLVEYSTNLKFIEKL